MFTLIVVGPGMVIGLGPVLSQPHYADIDLSRKRASSRADLA
jgi:hypothetical protein